MADGDRIGGKMRDEILDRRFGIEADLDRVRTHERAAEDAARQPRDVVALERLEDADGDFGGIRDLPQRDAAPLPGRAKRTAEIARGSICRHDLPSKRRLQTR